MPQDIAVFGATGFVGRLVAAYLAEHAPAGLEVALAGRSEAKLAQVRAELPPAAAGWPLVAADSADPASLTALAAGSGVIATTVGPYRRSGRALVDACIDAGTDYCDLTGEVLFVADTVERHADAERTGARIVHSTGFDSIPSDLGVFLLHEAVDRDGALQHAHRPPQRRAARPRLRARLSLPRGHRRGRRAAGTGEGRRPRGGNRGAARRPGLPADPPGARPGAPLTGRGTVRGGAAQGPVPDADPRRHDLRRPLRRRRRGQGRPGLRRHGDDDGSERPVPGPGRRPAPAGRRRPDAGHRDGRRAGR